MEVAVTCPGPAKWPGGGRNTWTIKWPGGGRITWTPTRQPVQDMQTHVVTAVLEAYPNAPTNHAINSPSRLTLPGRGPRSPKRRTNPQGSSGRQTPAPPDPRKLNFGRTAPTPSQKTQAERVFSRSPDPRKPPAGQNTGNKHPEIPSWPKNANTCDDTHATNITAHKCSTGLQRGRKDMQTHTCLLLCIHKALVNKYTHHTCHILHHHSRPKRGTPDAPAANTGATLGGPPCITNRSPRVSHGTRPRVEVLMRL